MTLLQCYAALDWDLGANAPAETTLGGKRLLVLPGKDGALYLIDADHLGTLYDRLVVAPPCGTPDDRCLADWAGMMVTQPAVDAETQLLLVPTFEFDRTHPAGVVAVAIEPGPRLAIRWQSPQGDEAERQFRRHPGARGLRDRGRADVCVRARRGRERRQRAPLWNAAGDGGDRVPHRPRLTGAEIRPAAGPRRPALPDVLRRRRRSLLSPGLPSSSVTYCARVSASRGEDRATSERGAAERGGAPSRGEREGSRR